MHSYVRAVYDFTSDDDASLSFKKGDIIEVLSKLESGWWNGNLNGEQGWFPSNYIEQYDSFKQLNEENASKLSIDLCANNNNLFTNSYDFNSYLNISDNNQKVQQNDLTNNWINQNITNDNFSFPINVSQTENNCDASLDNIDATLSSTVLTSRRPSYAEEWNIFLKNFPSLLNTPKEANSDNRDSAQFNNQNEILPSNWLYKLTPSGKEYYFNIKNDYTTWDINDTKNEDLNINLNKESNNRYSSAWNSAIESIDSKSSCQFYTPQKLYKVGKGDLGQNQNKFYLTWECFVNEIISTLHLFQSAIKHKRKSQYMYYSSYIISSIKKLLQASGTADRYVAIFKSHKLLEAYHHQILSSLCNLIIKAKIASGVWPPPDIDKTFFSETNNLIVLIRHFANTSQSTCVETKGILIEVKPNIFVRDSFKTKDEFSQLENNDSSPRSSIVESRKNSTGEVSDINFEPGHSNIEVLERFENVSRTSNIAIDCVLDLLETSPGLTPQLVSFLKRLINEIGQFICLVDHLCLDSVSEQAVYTFKTAKQILMDNSSRLVMVVQTSTDSPDNPDTFSDIIIDVCHQIGNSISDLLIAIKFIIEERDTIELIDLCKKLSALEEFENSFFLPEDNIDSGKTDAKNDFFNIPPPIRRCSSSSCLSPVIFNSPFSESDVTFGFNKLRRGSACEFYDRNSEILIKNEDSSSINIKKGAASSLKITNVQKTKFNSLQGSRNNKLNKFFGDVIPSGEDLEKVKKSGSLLKKDLTEPKPWYLMYDYNPNDIILTKNNQIKGGTLSALIERLTAHDHWDPNFKATLMLTYRSFATTQELFKHLFDRFLLQPPPNLTAEELEEWNEKKLTPIRLRVLNILKSWIETYYIDGQDNSALDLLKQFASTSLQEHMPFAKEQLNKFIEKRLESGDPAFKKMVLNLKDQAPPSIIPKNYKSFLDLDPSEIARQLTLMDSSLFNKIKPVECLNKAWSKKDSTAANIQAMIELSNQITSWVSNTILQESELKKRAQIIKHFIAIGEKCLFLNNYNSLTAILAGFNSSPIHRLRRTWELINSKSLQSFETLKEKISSSKNFAQYREDLHLLNPPCVPFLGVYLTDLTFIEDGNPDFLIDDTGKREEKLINFSKQSKTAEVIREIQQFQNQPYCLTPVPKMQEYIIKKSKVKTSNQDLYNRSLELEPREREEEKIARLLHESGFL